MLEDAEFPSPFYQTKPDTQVGAVVSAFVVLGGAFSVFLPAYRGLFVKVLTRGGAGRGEGRVRTEDAETEERGPDTTQPTTPRPSN